MAFNGKLRDNGSRPFNGDLTGSVSSTINVTDVATAVCTVLDAAIYNSILSPDPVDLISTVLVGVTNIVIPVPDDAVAEAITDLSDIPIYTSLLNAEIADVTSSVLAAQIDRSILATPVDVTSSVVVGTVGRVIDVAAPVTVTATALDALAVQIILYAGAPIDLVSSVVDPVIDRSILAPTADTTSSIPSPQLDRTIIVTSIADVAAQAGYARAVQHGTTDLGAFLTVAQRQYADIYARIRGLGTTKRDLPASILSIPYARLSATLNANLPRDIGAYIREGFKGEEDLGASATPRGSFSHLPAFIEASSSKIKDLRAFIEIKTPGNLRAYIHGFTTNDIGAFLITERIKNLRAIIIPSVSTVKNMGAFIRRYEVGLAKDMGVEVFKAVVSTHTSDKEPNLRIVSKIFYENKFVFGTHGKGLVAFNVEPVFGVFPDLHAYIFAQEYFREHISAFIRAYLRGTTDLPVTVRAVSPHIKINKVTLSPYPLKEISAFLNARGGYKSLKAILRPSHSVSTGTAPDAAFSTVASSYKFILGTGKGVFIPQQNLPTIITTFFNNTWPTPDLRATIRGWVTADLGAYIKDYSYKAISGSLIPIGKDRYRDLSSFIEPAYLSDISASIGTSGGHVALGASVNSAGYVSDVSASLLPYINPLSYNTIPVSTKPFRDMGAMINYTSILACAVKTQLISLSAYIRVLAGGPESQEVNIGAQLNALRLSSGMPATVTGRKRTRVRVLTLSFRAATRSTSFMSGIIVPVHQRYVDLSGSIYGLSHEADIGASISSVRHSLDNVLYTASEFAANLKDPSHTKEILLSFKGGVSRYVYEDITSAVYPTERGTWAIDLRSVNRQKSFFDRDPNSRVRVIDDITEFHSVDEAIRNAISIICDHVPDDMAATINSRGKLSHLMASVGVVGMDMIKDIPTKIVPVGNAPDIAAIINAGRGSSGYASLPTIVYAGGPETAVSLSASLNTQFTQEMGAEITAV